MCPQLGNGVVTSDKIIHHPSKKKRVPLFKIVESIESESTIGMMNNARA